MSDSEVFKKIISELEILNSRLGYVYNELQSLKNSIEDVGKLNLDKLTNIESALNSSRDYLIQIERNTGAFR